MQNIHAINLEKIDYQAFMRDIRSDFIRIQSSEVSSDFIRGVRTIFHKMSEIESYMSLSSFRYYGDTTDAVNKENFEFYSAIEPELKALSQELNALILNSPFFEDTKTAIGQNFYFETLNQNFTLTDHAKELLNKDIALSNELMATKSQARCTWEGEEISLSKLMIYTIHSDRAVRKKAWDLVSDYYVKEEEYFNSKFIELVTVRNEYARELGFSDYAAYSIKKWNRIQYDYTHIAQFRDALALYFKPSFQRIKEARRASLGVEKLTYYDNINFGDGVAQLLVKDANHTIEKVSEIISQINSSWGEQYEEMRKNQVIDYLDRPNKVDIGFANYLNDRKTPIIFSKLQNTEYDARVMIHEFGHTLQFLLSWEKTSNQTDRFCLDTVEIFSHSMELMAYPHMNILFGKDAHKFILGNFITQIGHLQTMPIGDEFQELVYKKENLSVLDLESIYRSCCQKYGTLPEDSSENEFYSNGKRWKTIDHFFHSPFYLIDYAIAIMMALQIYSIYREDKEKAIQLYEELANNIGNLNYPNLNNITDELSSPFDNAFIQKMANFVEGQLKSMLEGK